MGNSSSAKKKSAAKATTQTAKAKRVSEAAPVPVVPTTVLSESLHQSVVPSNPKLEALQTDKEVLSQIQEIEAKNPRATLQGVSEIESVTTDSEETYKMTVAHLSQTGYYPEDLTKFNQDTVSIMPELKHPSEKSLFMFSIYDGHGKVGDLCSQFSRDKVPEYLQKSASFAKKDAFDMALNDSFVNTNLEMHQQERVGKFSDMMSGTTAISAIIAKSTLYVANVGDSRAIMGVRDAATNTLRAEALSIDQTPFRQDERERVKKAGAVSLHETIVNI
jgi:hypothetical protein